MDRKSSIFLWVVLLIFSAGCVIRGERRVNTYPNGSKKELYFVYKNDAGQEIKHGTYISWWPNGIKSVEGKFKHGREDGKFIYWYSNGEKQMVGEYRAGLRHGQWTVYDPVSKKKLAEVGYSQGTQLGKWKIYDINGKVIQYVDSFY